MTERQRSLVALLASGGMAFLIANPALAQDAAAAAPTLASEGGAAEIVVTAQRRAERLQDVPISITAVSPQQIDNLNLKTIDDVAKITPGLNFDKALTFAQNYIRGVGTNYPQPGLESAVATYIDGAYVPRAVGIFDILDVQSVQILKGPQGTLYGRNASGGAILVETADPTYEPELRFLAEYGRFDHILGDVVANVPITPTLAIRVAARESHERGYVTNLFDGSKFGGRQAYQVRGKVKWEPTSDFSAVLTVQHNAINDRAGFTAARFGPPICLPCGIPGSPAKPVSGFYEVDNDVNEPFRSRSTSVNLRMKLDMGMVSVESITSYRDQTFFGIIDQDFTSLPLFTYNTSKGNGKTFTQDLIFSTNSGGMIDGMVGVSYLHDNAVQAARLFGLALAPLEQAFGELPEAENKYPTRSYSAFAEVYLTPVENLKVTLGGRFTRDERRVTGVINAAAQAALTPPGSPLTFANSVRFNSFTPRAVIAYDFGDLNAYVSYNRGFKAGGYNSPTFVDPNIIKPEKITNYEIGAKYVSPDRRLTFNFAAFRYDYKDLQVAITDFESGGQSIQNAASARGKGIELEASFAPAPWLTLSLGGAYLDAKYRKFENASVNFPTDAGLVTGPLDISGRRMIRAPKFTGNIGFGLNIPVGDDWRLRADGTMRYTSRYDFYPGAGGPLGYDVQPRRTLLDMSAGIGPSDDRYEIGVYGSNLLGEKYFLNRQTTAPYGTAEAVAPPRTYGVRVKYRF